MLALPMPGAQAAAVAQPLNVFAVQSQPLTARPKSRFALRRIDLNVLSGHASSMTGVLRPRLGGEKVVLEALFGRRWRPVADALTGARGRFRLRYVPRQLGSWQVQLRFAGDEANAPVTHRLGALSSYRVVDASWYGGGGETACGSYLTSSTMGVANKTLPCGTPVTIRYDGHEVTVPVIDRGPYVEGREYDLTEATKNALGFEGVEEVWATH